MSTDYILIVTNKIDAHVDVVADELHARNSKFIRMNTEDFPTNIRISYESDCDRMKIHCLDSDIAVDVSSITSIWYRRPEAYVIDPAISDAAFRTLASLECAAVMDGLSQIARDKLWINHPIALRMARPKIFQLSVAKKIGFIVPKTIVTNDPHQARKFIESRPGDVVTKTLCQPSINRNNGDFFTIFTNIIRQEDTERLAEVQYAPTLFQEYVHKNVEIRVTIFGKYVFSAEIHSQENELTKHDYRRTGIDIQYCEHKLPKQIEDMCLELVRKLNLLYGAIDLILTPDNKYVFLEINPNGQWYWIEELTGMPMLTTFVDLLTQTRQA